jgi:hypothetical protein
MSIDAAPHHGQKLCPSTPAQEGAVVVTILGTDGRPAYLPDRMVVTDDLLQQTDPDTLERRFRFASPCQEAACGHWSDSRCGIPAKLAALVTPDDPSRVPRCSIRHDCRWFAQAGFDACRLCPLVARTAQSQGPAQGPANGEMGVRDG